MPHEEKVAPASRGATLEEPPSRRGRRPTCPALWNRQLSPPRLTGEYQGDGVATSVPAFRGRMATSRNCSRQARTNVLWLIGDWWRFGNKTYGSRKALVDRRDWEGPSYQTCRNAASVAEKFQLSRRRYNLSFAHHAEVAALHPAQADHWLDWCEETIATEGKPRSVRELRAQVQRSRPAVGAITSKATCTVEDLSTLVSEVASSAASTPTRRGAIPTKQRGLPRMPTTAL